MVDTQAPDSRAPIARSVSRDFQAARRVLLAVLDWGSLMCLVHTEAEGGCWYVSRGSILLRFAPAAPCYIDVVQRMQKCQGRCVMTWGRRKVRMPAGGGSCSLISKIAKIKIKIEPCLSAVQSNSRKMSSHSSATRPSETQTLATFTPANAYNATSDAVMPRLWSGAANQHSRTRGGTDSSRPASWTNGESSRG